MEGKGVCFSIFLALTVIGTTATGTLHILHSPNSIEFSGSSKLRESALKELYSAAVGFSVEENCNWNGLSLRNPFELPEAIVEINVDGVSNLGNTVMWESKDYTMIVDENEPDTFEIVAHRIRQHSLNSGNKLVNINLHNTKELNSHSDVFGKIGHIKPGKQTLQYLKYTNDVDHQFLTDIEALKVLTSKVASGIVVPDNVIDFYKFKFTSLHTLSDFHGATSLPTQEAKKILVQALEGFKDAFKKAYDDSVLFVVTTTDKGHIRRVRAAGEESTSTRQSSEEGAYSPDYPAIFNIILWFSVVFIFALIAIVYAIMDMDPGRDSIIYRMTSTRMKKDN